MATKKAKSTEHKKPAHAAAKHHETTHKSEHESAKSHVPHEWPGAFGIYKKSRDAVKLNGMVYFQLVVVYILVAIASNLIGNMLSSDKNVSQNISSTLTSIVGIFFDVAFTFMFLNGARGKKVELNDTFNRAKEFFWQNLLLNILITLALIGSFLALVIPIFFVAPRLTLATYFLIDKKLPAIDAFKASWKQTKGHVGKVYGIIGANIAMVLLMVTIIGIPFSIYFLIMYSAATAILYGYITRKHA